MFTFSCEMLRIAEWLVLRILIVAVIGVAVFTPSFALMYTITSHEVEFGNATEDLEIEYIAPFLLNLTIASNTVALLMYAMVAKSRQKFVSFVGATTLMELGILSVYVTSFTVVYDFMLGVMKIKPEYYVMCTTISGLSITGTAIWGACMVARCCVHKWHETSDAEDLGGLADSDDELIEIFKERARVAGRRYRRVRRQHV